MRPPRRYSEWRPVTRRRVPARWIGTVVGSLAFAAVGTHFNPSSITVMGATALGVFVANRVATRRMKDLRDEGEDRQFAAVLRLSRGVDYGHDEGLVSFEDGYLVFMGRRCAFSLGARDVSVRKIDVNELGFGFKGPKGTHSAELRLLRNKGFEEAARAWSNVERKSREGVLPPPFPDPTHAPAVILLINALPALALLAACLVVRGHSASDRWLHPLFVALVSLGVVGWTVLQAVELVRLSRGERSLASRLRASRRRLSLAKRAASSPLALPRPQADGTPVEVRRHAS